MLDAHDARKLFESCRSSGVDMEQDKEKLIARTKLHSEVLKLVEVVQL